VVRWKSEAEMLTYFTRGGKTPVEYYIVWGGTIWEWEPHLASLMTFHRAEDVDDERFRQYLSGRGWKYETGAEVNAHAERHHWPEWVPVPDGPNLGTDAESDDTGIPF
jgi:hypothetical protein